MMKRILILCEGQTEETFVKRILAPHLQHFQKSLIPVILVTKKVKSGKEFHGGITSYDRIRRDVIHLLRDSNAVCITTMLDYYGLPSDFPGKRSLQERTPYERVTALENAFAQDINERRFLPYLSLHEFEALLFVQPEKITETLGQKFNPRQFGNLQYNSPEEINEGPETHPSARIRKSLIGYRKPLHRPLIIERIGLHAIRSRCPHFNEWLKKLENM